MKKDLPPGPYTWDGGGYRKDENGNYRFVYSGEDAQAGMNVNALVFEIPLGFITESPDEERIVAAWGESWVLKASSKVETIADDPFWLDNPVRVFRSRGLDDELKRYKLVDT